MKNKRLVSIGECLLELTECKANQFDMNYAGDSFNTAYYLAHLSDLSVYFGSVIGSDPYSHAMRDFFIDNKIHTDYLYEDTTRLSGLYFVKTDDNGERRFYYYREKAAAKNFFKRIDNTSLKRLSTFDFLYTTGVGLAIFNNKHELLNLMVEAKNTKVYFDNNFRETLWLDREKAQTFYDSVHPHCDALFVTFDDEAKLYGDNAIDDTVKRYQAKKLPLVIIKDGPHPAMLIENGSVRSFPPPKVDNVVDTTGAGDSFNALIIKALACGTPIDEAIHEAHALASRVIQYQGALISKELLNLS